MNKMFLSLILIMTMLVGCAGRKAIPVMIQQVGDKQKTCQTVKAELVFIEGEIQRLLPQTDKKRKNVFFIVTGLFFGFPVFFVDLSKAEQEEIDAYRQRYIYLLTIASDNGCKS